MKKSWHFFQRRDHLQSSKLGTPSIYSTSVLMLPCLDFIFSNSSICFCLLFSSSSCLRSSSSYEVSRLKDFLLLISRCCSFMGEARDLLFLTGEVGLEVRRLGSGSGGSSMLTVGRAVAIAVKKKLTFKPTALKVLWNSDLCWSFLAFLYFCFPSKQYAIFILLPSIFLIKI